jgi:predicted lipopolysaccharide heptosyltransferase III
VEGPAQKPARHIPNRYTQDTISEAATLLHELQQIPRILLIRLRSLGDAILTLPLIEALNQWRPELKQSILIEAPFAPVFLNHPAVDEILILQSRRGTEPEGWARFQSIYELWKRHYPAVLNLHGGTTSMLLSIATGAPIRIGQLSHRGSWIYNRRIPASAVIWQRQALHTVENQLSPMRWLGLPIPSRPATLYVDQTARNRIHKRLADEGISEYILIQPTATLPTKQWQPAKFAQLGDQLFNRYGLPVIYTAAPHEAKVLKEISNSAAERHACWSDLPIMELFALIERCRLFVGCDSGPTHAAAALGRPVVVAWGSSNFQAWHPWQTDFEAVRSDLPCIPCPGYTCKVFGEPKCILEIPVSRVMDACAAIFERSR